MLNDSEREIYMTKNVIMKNVTEDGIDGSSTRNELHHGINEQNRIRFPSPSPSPYCMDCAIDGDVNYDFNTENSNTENGTIKLTSMLLSRILPEINTDELEPLRKLIQEQVNKIKSMQDTINEEHERKVNLETKFAMLKENYDQGLCCQEIEKPRIIITKKNDDFSDEISNTPVRSQYVVQRKIIQQSTEVRKKRPIKLVYSAPLSQKRLTLKPLTIGRKKMKQSGLGHFFRTAVGK